MNAYSTKLNCWFWIVVLLIVLLIAPVLVLIHAVYHKIFSIRDITHNIKHLYESTWFELGYVWSKL